MNILHFRCEKFYFYDENLKQYRYQGIREVNIVKLLKMASLYFMPVWKWLYHNLLIFKSKIKNVVSIHV